MKKVLLIPLIATGALVGCQDKQQAKQQNVAIESEKQIAAWVGKYQGTTPCMGCLSRCDDCPGMAVTLELYENRHYKLERISLSGHNEVETSMGQIRFTDQHQQQIELVNLAQRNLLYVDLAQQLLEIREDVNAQKYQMQSDFILQKQV